MAGYVGAGGGEALRRGVVSVQDEQDGTVRGLPSAGFKTRSANARVAWVQVAGGQHRGGQVEVGGAAFSHPVADEHQPVPVVRVRVLAA